MAYQKLQTREALNVIPSDSVRIPDPNTVVIIDTATGTSTGVGDFSSLNKLTDVGTKFTELGILPGAIVYAGNQAYYVVNVDSDTVLNLSGASAAGGASITYSIYTAATTGCALFVGGTGDINVRMAQHNGNTPSLTSPANINVLYKNIANASFLPIQVIQVQVKNTSATDIIAMW